MSDAKAYSLGCEGLTQRDIAKILWDLGKPCIIDVRNATDIKNDELSKTALREFAYSIGLGYKDYTKVFSMDCSERRYLTAAGYMDFAKYSQSPEFIAASMKLKKGVDMGYSCCLLGHSTGPGYCHRSYLIAHDLLRRGLDVIHLMPEMQWPHSELEELAIDDSFSTLDQTSLFYTSDEEQQAEHEVQRKQVVLMYNKRLGDAWLAKQGNPAGAGQRRY